MKTPLYIDAHSHLQDPRVALFLSEWIQKSAERGIVKHLLGGVDPEDWQRQHVIASHFPGRVRASFGLHPWWIANHDNDECDEALAILDEMLLAFGKDPNVDRRPWALGETGLDFHERFSEDTHERQIEFFEAHLDRAETTGLPLILHIVQAHPQAIQVLHDKRTAARGYAGIIHSFGGSYEIAAEYQRLGFLISISAAVLTRGSGKAFDSLKHAVLSLDPEVIVLETDAPDQPPADRKGQMNTPLALVQVAEAMAQIRGGTAEEWLERSATNLTREFGV